MASGHAVGPGPAPASPADQAPPGAPASRHGDPSLPAVAARAVLESVPPSMRAIRLRMRASGASGLTVPQFRALVFVRRHPATDLSTIADHLGTSVPAASELVNRLVRQGLVLRAADERERRRICLTLSDAGSAHLERAEGETLEWLEAVLAGLETERLEALVEALGDLRRLVGEGGGPAAQDAPVPGRGTRGRPAPRASQRD